MLCWRACIVSIPSVLLGKSSTAMDVGDEETPLLRLHPPPQGETSEYTGDGSVDINNQPALKRSTGKWRACFLILSVEFCEDMAFFTISKNLVTYLTTVLHESKVTAARNMSAWVGASFFTPLFGGFIADTYWGRYWTIVASFPLIVAAMVVLIASASLPIFSTSSDHGGSVHRLVVYFGMYLAAIASGGVKPCTPSFGADQFDTSDHAEQVTKGSFFSWYFFLLTTSNLLAGTVIVWLQDNVGWAVSYVIPTVLMLICYPAFLAGSKVYRFRKMGVSPLTSILQVVAASVRKWHIELPDDSSLLYEPASLPSGTDANCKIEHTNEFRFLDKAAIVPAPSDSDNESTVQTSPWRLCTVTQVEELKMLLRMSPIWASFVVVYMVDGQMSTTLVEQGMFMDNRVGSFTIPPASMSTVGVISCLLWVPIYEMALVPLARRFTGKDKGFSQAQRLGTGLALSMLTMVYAALLETRRLAVAEASGLRDQDAPVPMSIMWQAPLHFVHGASRVFAGVGATEFFYDQSPETMKSLCAALGQLALASASYINSLLLSVVAVATRRRGAPGWIPDNLNQGHLDYFFWMMATFSLLNVALFVRYSMRQTVKMAC